MIERIAILIVPCVIAVTLWAQHTRREQNASRTATSSAQALILQENDGERRIRRPAPGPKPAPEFVIKIDGQNGRAQDFYALTEFLEPEGVIPFHQHHNAEEVLLLEEGGAMVTAGNKRAYAGPHSIVFIPRNTWVSVTNNGKERIHITAIFSRLGFERSMRARSVRPGEPLKPITAEEFRRSAELGQAMFWDTSKGPHPPGVPTP